jgi:hypothetical protein
MIWGVFVQFSQLIGSTRQQMSLLNLHYTVTSSALSFSSLLPDASGEFTRNKHFSLNNNFQGARDLPRLILKIRDHVRETESKVGLHISMWKTCSHKILCFHAPSPFPLCSHNFGAAGNFTLQARAWCSLHARSAPASKHISARSGGTSRLRWRRNF